MVVQRGDLACCVRCAGPAAGARLARRYQLKAALQAPATGPLERIGTVAATAVTGTVLDSSPQIVTIYGPGGERRIALPPGAGVWKGRRVDATALESGDTVVVRMRPGQRSVADRIWANAGRVTGVIVERDRESMLVDEGRTTRRQAVLIPPHVTGRLQVRFPRLQPGYLVDFIGLRGRGFLEALVPATSQPAYRASEAPARTPPRGHATARIAGSAVWHEAAGPADEDGVRYPALDPETSCQEQPLAGSGCPRLPYLSVGSLLQVRNECTGSTRVLPVSGCAATAQVFCDRCVTCGTSPRGRVADLPMASFVALGGDLERGCFNATVSLGHPEPEHPGPGHPGVVPAGQP